MDKNKKSFISTIVSPSLFIWISQLVVGGVIQALVAFFTKKKLEKIDGQKGFNDNV